MINIEEVVANKGFGLFTRMGGRKDGGSEVSKQASKCKSNPWHSHPFAPFCYIQHVVSENRFSLNNFNGKAE